MAQRKTEPGKVPISAFQKTATDIKIKLSIRKGAEKHGIDGTTLKRYLKKVAKDGTDNATMGYFSHRKVFTAAMETDLAQHLCYRLYGLTPSKVRSLAWEYASKNNIKRPQNWITEKMAGKHWLNDFMHRYKLSLRVPEATSTARATAFNRHNVSIDFDDLNSVMEQYKFDPGHIYNMDKTGCSTVQSYNSFRYL